MLFKNSGKYKCDAQLSWMAEPHIEEFKLDNIVFPFTLGQCPVDPITEDIAEGIMGGLIVWQHLSPNLETYIEKSLETLGYALTRAMLCLPTNEREALYQRYIALVSDDELVSAIFALPTECWNVECTRWAESGLTVFLAYMPLKGFLYFLDEYSEGNPTVFTPYFETQGSSIKLLIESMEGKENEDCYRLIDAWKRRTLRFTNLNFEEEMRNLKIVAAVSLENGKTPTGAVEERVYRFK